MANKSVRNERRKLSANFLNGFALAMIAVGGLTQVAAMANSGQVSVTASLSAVICVATGIALHFVARASLRGMEE